MKKRFTDADKWEDPWFGDLPSKYKLFWLYLLDRVDHAGFWKVNFRVAKFFIGEDLEPAEVKRVLRDRIEPVNDQLWFVPKFLKFQYPNGLSINSKAQKSVIDLIINNNCIDRVKILYGNSYLTVQDKDKDKDKDKDRDKDKDKDKDKSETPKKNEILMPYTSPEFTTMWNHWKEYKKKEHGFKYRSIQSQQATLNKLANMSKDEKEAAAIIKQSMENGWKGFFELKTKPNETSDYGKQRTKAINEILRKAKAGTLEPS